MLLPGSRELRPLLLSIPHGVRLLNPEHPGGCLVIRTGSQTNGGEVLLKALVVKTPGMPLVLLAA